MRIAVVAERYDPAGGGAERSTAQVVGELVGRGHAVTVLAGAAPRELAPEDFTLERSPRESTRSAVALVAFARWARRRLREGGFDTGLSMTTAVPAPVVEPRSGTIRETHARNVAVRRSPLARAAKRLTLALSAKARALRWLEARALADPDVRRWVAISGYVQRQLTGAGVEAERIVRIANAAVAADHDDAGDRDELREAFGVAPGQTAFLFAALNPRLKGAGTLVRAMARLEAAGEDFVVLGAGFDGYRERRQAERLGVAGRLRILGPCRTMGPLYRVADMTVHPTFYDPSSKVVIESLLAGTPAISTACNGASEWLEGQGFEPRGRVIADPADDAALAAAMGELCDEAARARCRSSIESMAAPITMREHVDRLEEVLSRA